MKFVITNRPFPHEDIQALQIVREALHFLSGTKVSIFVHDPDLTVTPRMICRALEDKYGKLLRLKCVHGFFSTVVHSWLVTENGNIIDVLLVDTFGGPHLVDGHSCHVRQLYKEAMLNPAGSEVARCIRAIADVLPSEFSRSQSG